MSVADFPFLLSPDEGNHVTMLPVERAAHIYIRCSSSRLMGLSSETTLTFQVGHIPPTKLSVYRPSKFVGHLLW